MKKLLILALLVVGCYMPPPTPVVKYLHFTPTDFYIGMSIEDFKIKNPYFNEGDAFPHFQLISMNANETIYIRQEQEKATSWEYAIPQSHKNYYKFFNGKLAEVWKHEYPK